jgi:hypothetical protein
MMSVDGLKCSTINLTLLHPRAHSQNGERFVTIATPAHDASGSMVHHFTITALRYLIDSLLCPQFNDPPPTHLKPSIFRAGPGSGRVEKNYVISGRKNPTHDYLLDPSGLNFRAGSELGQAARAF